MMTLSERNKARMERDIARIIDDWADHVQVFTPKPAELQPGWNPIMREIVGDVQYDILSDVPVERRDVPLSELEPSVVGDKFRGESILRIPRTYIVDDVVTPIVITEESMFVMDGNSEEPWRVKSIKDRLGEREVRVIKMVGDV